MSHRRLRLAAIVLPALLGTLLCGVLGARYNACQALLEDSRVSEQRLNLYANNLNTYALTVSIFGGTAEVIALKFKDAGYEIGFYWYVTACIAVSLLVYVFMKDTRTTSRIETD